MLSSHRRITLLLVLVLAVAALGAYFGLIQNGASSANSDSLVANVNGVTVRIASVDYASTSTTLPLELTNPLIQTSHFGYLFQPIQDKDMVVQGLAPVERIDQALHHGENGVDRRDLRLGAVQDPNAPVVFEIERLCPFQANLHCDYRDGPWRFEWTPGAAP